MSLEQEGFCKIIFYTVNVKLWRITSGQIDNHLFIMFIKIKKQRFLTSDLHWLCLFWFSKSNYV